MILLGVFALIVTALLIILLTTVAVGLGDRLAIVGGIVAGVLLTTLTIHLVHPQQLGVLTP